MDLQEIKVDDLRSVVAQFVNGKTNSHLVHKDDVQKLVEAFRKLHADPGVNPHNKGMTTPCHSVSVYRFSSYLSKPYWWTGPSLRDDGTGATLIQFEEPESYHEFQCVNLEAYQLRQQQATMTPAER